MSQYFPEPKSLGGKVKVELDLSNYATKTDLKNATGVDASSFAKKIDLVNLKCSVYKLDIDKLKNIPTNLSNLKSKLDKLDFDKSVPVFADLSKLSDVVQNDVVKKDVYNAKIKDIEDKIPDIINLATNATLNATINEVKTKYLVLLTELQLQLLMIKQMRLKTKYLILPTWLLLLFSLFLLLLKKT